MIKKLLGNVYIKYAGENNRLERIWKIAQVDFKKRFYNDRFGLLWALINPLTQLGLYYFVFVRILQRGQDNFVFFLFSAIIIWLAFSSATILSLRLLIDKLYLITNIQFNWLDLYLSHMISASIAFIFNLLAYLITLLIMGVSLGSYFYLFPIILLTWFIVTLACCIILSLIKPIFEDITHIWSILLMAGLWVSGVFFDGSFYSDNYSWFSYMNPFVGILQNGRACLLEGYLIDFNLLVYNLIFGIGLLFIAILIFNKYAKRIIEKL